MPHCLPCQNEFIEGVQFCSDCGLALREGPLPEPEDVTRPEFEWKYLTSCNTDLEAVLLEQLLDNIGIMVLKKSTWRGSYVAMGGTARMPGEQIRLFVAAHQLGRAKILIKQRIAAGKSLGLRRSTGSHHARIIRLRNRTSR